jgi:GrpB-like predicted nucleotidyltransferase (UPF0157 family)
MLAEMLPGGSNTCQVQGLEKKESALWKTQFEVEQSTISEVVGDTQVVLSVDHVGGTAVGHVGLGATPVVDVLVGVVCLEDFIIRCALTLHGEGYEVGYAIQCCKAQPHQRPPPLLPSSGAVDGAS